jgi:hypothetical protein
VTNGTETKPNGPVAAVFLAAGIGSLVLGLMVIVAEMAINLGGETTTRTILDFSRNYGLGSGVGPLSGKVTIAVIAFVASWVIAHLALRGKEVNFGRYLAAAVIMVALGLLFTFPPFFLLFEPAG